MGKTGTVLRLLGMGNPYLDTDNDLQEEMFENPNLGWSDKAWDFFYKHQGLFFGAGEQAAAMSPVGWTVDMYDMGNALKSGNPLLVGLAGLQFLPGVPRMMGAADEVADAGRVLHRNGFYEVLTDAPLRGRTRGSHRRAANRDLLRRLVDDPVFC